MDMKAWLATSGLTVKESSYLKQPTFPYVVFTDDCDAGYHDLTHKNIMHSVTVELYETAISTTDEALIEALITDLLTRYTKRRDWLDSESCYITTFEFDYEEIE